jgi:hypothetical protein
MKSGEHFAGVSERLQIFDVADRKKGLSEAFLHFIEDPLKPRTDKGKVRASRLLLLLALLALLGGSTFIFFSVLH